jgi:hypothetical protein
MLPGFTSSPRRAGIEEVPLSQFSQGRTIWIRLQELIGLDRDEV